MVIKEHYYTWAPERCDQWWTEWQDISCIGCYTLEPTVVDHKTKHLFVCRHFLEKLYTVVDAFNTPAEETERAKDKDLTVPPLKYDSCGFFKPRRHFQKYEDGNVRE